MSEILVIGHKNPDTDAICSAIGYAEFKRRTGMAEAVAARCGDTNDRIDFVLKTFGVPAPKFVADVSPKISDVMQRRVLSVRPDSTAAEALRLMDEKNLRLLPVLDEAQKCRGLLSLFKLSKFLFPAVNLNAGPQHNSREVLSSLAGLAQTLDGQLVVGFDTEREEELILMIGAMGLESFAARLEKFPPEKSCVIVGDRWDIQNVAIREGVRVLIVTGGIAVEPKTLEAAQQTERQRHHLAPRHRHHRVAVPRGRGRAPRVERAIPLLPRERAAGRRARGGHVLRLPGLSRAGQRRRDRGHFVQDGFSEDRSRAS